MSFKLTIVKRLREEIDDGTTRGFRATRTLADTTTVDCSQVIGARHFGATTTDL
ncbi:hypothetical protein HY224_01385 [Candidatus Uhrbacteria bacterium]|nr:hypothetical protein [Candidatus Uhrbacteria bacterium]